MTHRRQDVVAPSREGSPDRAEASMAIASRLLAACPAPGLLVVSGGRVRLANAAAAELMGRTRAADLTGVAVRDLLGVGWRELVVTARAGHTDLVAQVTGAGPRRGARVRVEAIGGPDPDGPPTALVAFLTPTASEPLGHRGSGRRGLEAIFGHDPALLSAKDAAERFARTLLPVLLLAETGTGKELLARALHLASHRCDQPFVAINCGALSAHLLESELFGYAPGAFTGASREGNEGKIGAARGGTLFLDEVGEMPGPLQALLLRVLEDGTYYRVGESRPRQADIRLICATCRDLPGLVEEGGFRKDLFYRINGACLSLPPVRQRIDVAELVDHLLEELAQRSDLHGSRSGRLPSLAPEARDWILRHPWPGNVRQLKTALQHALILCDGDEIGLVHLPIGVEGQLASTEIRHPGPGSLPEDPSIPATASAPPSRPRSPTTLAAREADRLLRAVDEADGNLSRAARRLGVARSTLYRRLRRHGLIE